MRAARARPQATAGGEDDTGLFPRKTRHRPCLVLAARHPCQTSPQGASPGRRALRLLFHLFICCGCVRAGGSGRAPVEVRAYCCLQVHSVHKNITDIQCTVYHTIVRRSNPSRLLGGHARRFGRPRLRHRARLLVGCHPQRWMGGASETSRRRSPHSCTRGDPRLLRRPGARAHTRGVRCLRPPTAHLQSSAPRRPRPPCVSAAPRFVLTTAASSCAVAAIPGRVPRPPGQSSLGRGHCVARPQRVSWPRQRVGLGRCIAWSWSALAAPSPQHLGVSAHHSGLAASAWPPMARRRRPTPPRHQCGLAPVVGSRTTTASAG